jgi:endo-1,4-beta-xylanase
MKTRPRIARWLVVPIIAVTGAVALIAPAHAAGPLRANAATRGKFIGAALDTNLLANNATYRNLAATEFSQVTAENAMKWDTTEPSDNNFNFTGADQIVNFATQNNQQVHGHTLVWHSQTPGWVQGLSATAMRTAMQDHITTEVGRYASNPTVVSWDVVNEIFNDDGTRRQSFWQNTLGDGYVADAFRFARAADSNARLCINDFNIEGIGAKSNAVFNLVSSLRQQGVPVDCVGFQTHLGIQFGFPNQFQQNLQRFADLGVQVRITELDVRMVLPRDSTKDATQATFYTNVVNGCNAVAACAGITVWGVDDGHSWVPSTFSGQGAALLWDEGFNQKPVYTAVSNALGGGTGGDTTAPSAPTNLAAAGTTTTSTNLSWTASTDNTAVTGYDILRATGATGGTFAQVGTATTTSFSNTGLTANTTYRFQVRARDAAGNVSAVSNTITVTTLAGGGGGGCSVVATTQTQWQTGYVIQPATVTNSGTATITAWTVTFTLPAGHAIIGSWNTALTISGQTVTARNAASNGTVAAGGHTEFGFQVSRPDGNTALPTGFTCTTP